MTTRLTPSASSNSHLASARLRLRHVGTLALTFGSAVLTPSMALAGQSPSALPLQGATAWNSLPESVTLVVFGSLLAAGATLARRAEACRAAGATTPSHHPGSHPQSAAPHAR